MHHPALIMGAFWASYHQNKCEECDWRSSTEFNRVLDSPRACWVFQQLIHWNPNTDHPHRVGVHLERDSFIVPLRCIQSLSRKVRCVSLYGGASYRPQVLAFMCVWVWCCGSMCIQVHGSLHHAFAQSDLVPVLWGARSVGMHEGRVHWV